MSRPRNLFGLVKKESFYDAKPSSFSVLIEDAYYIEPKIIQPTPRGAEVIAAHYRKKYSVDIRIEDHTECVLAGDKLNDRFAYFIKNTLSQIAFEENKPVGFLLMHGMNHAVPVLVSKEADKMYMIIFDATSGSRKKGYYTVANMLPEYQVLLNNGTRQSDTGSCVTDGLVILKDALRMNQLANHLIKHKITTAGTATPSPERNSQFILTLSHNNFSLFSMPEKLLKTAQISDYVDNADPDYDQVIGKKGMTLAQRREQDKLLVSLNKKPEVVTGINSFLYNKSRKHGKIMDEEIERINNLKTSSR